MRPFITLIVFILFLNAATIPASEKIGVLLMHGKGGTQGDPPKGEGKDPELAK